MNNKKQIINTSDEIVIKRGDIVRAWDEGYENEPHKMRYTGGQTHTGRYICEPLQQPVPGIEQFRTFGYIDHYKEEPTLRDKIENYVEQYDNNEMSLKKTLDFIMSEINSEIGKIVYENNSKK